MFIDKISCFYIDNQLFLREYSKHILYQYKKISRLQYLGQYIYIAKQYWPNFVVLLGFRAI